MDQRNGLTNVDVVAVCTKILGDLEQEIQAATHAIARNKLTELEESLWRQETLCARLKRSLCAITPAMLRSEVPVTLRGAASRLRAQSQVYETLVTRASRSTAILQHLCFLYRTAAQHPGTAMYRAISHEA